MRRILKFSLLLALVGGSISAQCPGGNCGYWSPWSVRYYQSPCVGGKCSTGKKTEPVAADKSNSGKKGNAAVTAPEPADPVIPEVKPFCERVIELVNAQRKAAGLSPLALDETLCRGCESHSRYMRSNGFQHAYGAGLECIAYGVATPEAVVNLWLNSSGHRAILLGRGSKIGVGFSGTFWTLRVR